MPATGRKGSHPREHVLQALALLRGSARSATTPAANPTLASPDGSSSDEATDSEDARTAPDALLQPPQQQAQQPAQGALPPPPRAQPQQQQAPQPPQAQAQQHVQPPGAPPQPHRCRIHGVKWLEPLYSSTECEAGLARSVSMRSATGTDLNVGIVSGAPGIATEWSRAPCASRAPYTRALPSNGPSLPFLRSSTATGLVRVRVRAEAITVTLILTIVPTLTV